MNKLLLILPTLLLPAILMANEVVDSDTIAIEQAVDTIVADTAQSDIDSLQKPYILDDMPLVRVHQDSLIEALLKEKVYGISEMIEMDGFRVQIFSSNRQQTAKEEALSWEKKMTDALSTAVYVTYISPLWKVRLGNFHTYEEANAFKVQLITQFPELQGDTYIVRDKIQVRK